MKNSNHYSKVIFISGPYRAGTPYQIQENIRKAEAVALEVWKRGDIALCPHKNTALFDGECLDYVWLEGDLELLRRCDGMILVPGWENSSGVKAEIAEALKLGIPIEYPCAPKVNHISEQVEKVNSLKSQ